MVRLLAFILASFFALSFAMAEAVSLRWTFHEDTNAELQHVLNVINQNTGDHYTDRDFREFESRKLATSNYYFYLQIGGTIPIQGRSLRIWTDDKGQLVQVEAVLESKKSVEQKVAAYKVSGISIQAITSILNSRTTMAIVRSYLEGSEDPRIFNVSWREEWLGHTITRYVKVKSRRGEHHLWIDSSNGIILKSYYEAFPQIDLPAMVYPIYEQPEDSTTTMPRTPVILKNLKDQIVVSTKDPFSDLRKNHYYEEMLDPILGLMPEYQAKGYWSSVWLKQKAGEIIRTLPKQNNDFKTGMVLEGPYATINLHPDVVSKFKNLSFKPQPSPQYKPNWISHLENGKDVWELIPQGSLRGKPIKNVQDLYLRPADRLPNHDPVKYINSGFDEVQVYWAINKLVESLMQRGFVDPELSTRPWNAFLFDPDISYRNNAYYTDDTINFTTYTGDNANFARDNPTIWHELGHGVMDRLMGDYITLADTGGLSEGMADFIAQLVVQDVSDGKDFEGSENFRIKNKIGFHLTNEVHDDGEAYGGTMHDFLLLALEKYGRDGLSKVVDLTLEAMRLSRNHPALTAQEWFNHMLFADERSSHFRSAGELGDLLITALKGRNYRFDDGEPASFNLYAEGQLVDSKGPGSRPQPILHQIAKADSVTYNMKVQLKSTESYHFKYPVTVKVQLEKGPIQGAIHWQDQSDTPISYTLNSEADVVEFQLKAFGQCDEINRDDGSCVDFAWVQIWNNGETAKPVAKKRFYLRIKATDAR